MWVERFVIVVTSLHRDFLPSSWELYSPSWVDWGILAGSSGSSASSSSSSCASSPSPPWRETKRLRYRIGHGEAA